MIGALGQIIGGIFVIGGGIYAALVGMDVTNGGAEAFTGEWERRNAERQAANEAAAGEKSRKAA